MITLDIFKENMHNKTIESEIDAWLTFMCIDEPAKIIELIEAYPEFMVMYEELYQMCLNIERVMGMFSKELLELDRNTVQYMIEEREKEVKKLRKQLAEQNKAVEEQKREVEERNREVEERKREAEERKREAEERKREAEERKRKVEEQNVIIEKKEAENENLRKMLDEMKAKLEVRTGQ